MAALNVGCHNAVFIVESANALGSLKMPVRQGLAILCMQVVQYPVEEPDDPVRFNRVDLVLLKQV